MKPAAVAAQEDARATVADNILGVDSREVGDPAAATPRTATFASRTCSARSACREPETADDGL